mgnify:CR=1 FL=1
MKNLSSILSTETLMPIGFVLTLIGAVFYVDGIDHRGKANASSLSELKAARHEDANAIREIEGLIRDLRGDSKVQLTELKHLQKLVEEVRSKQ